MTTPTQTGPTTPPRRQVGHLVLVAAVALAWALVGCTGTTLPEPPNLAPVDPGGLGSTEFERVNGIEVLGIRAVDPGVEVWAINLDTTLPPVTTLSDGDGDFGLIVDGTPGHELRLQARLDGRRSTPLDVVNPPTGGFRLVERPECISAPLELDLADAPSRTLSLSHSCIETVELVAVRWRAGTTSLVVDAPDLGSLMAGEVRTLTVRHMGTAAEEDILFLDLELGGTPVRHPVSVYALPP